MLLAAGSLLAYLALYIPIPDWKLTMVRFIGVALVTGFCWLKAIILVQRGEESVTQQRIIMLAGLLFRLALLPIGPFTSTDIYRYVWDGRVQAAGINPYRYAPPAPELAMLRDQEIYPNINNPSLPTIYPPLAEGFFFIAYKIGQLGVGGIVGIKLLALIADLAALALLWRLLARQKMAPPSYLVIYWWAPLIILEFFISTHVDALGVPLLLLFLYYMQKEQLNRAAAALAGAALIKLLPVVFLPAIVWRLGVKRSVKFLAIFALVLVIGYLPFLTVGTGVFFSLFTYMRSWTYNSSVYSVLETITSTPMAARAICYLAIIGWAAVVAIRLAGERLTSAMFWTLVGLYLFFPTVFPWYLSWLVPFTVFERARASWIFLALVPISYWLQAGYNDPHIVLEGVIVRMIEYAPLLLLVVQKLAGKYQR